MNSFVCDLCNASFPDSKALASHKRAKHNVRTNARLYAYSDALCRACGVKFCTRTRLIAHLTDSRRTKRLRWVESNVKPLDDETARQLDLLDRQVRQDALNNGYNQPRYSAPAMKGGRIMGCAGHEAIEGFSDFLSGFTWHQSKTSLHI